MTRAPLRQSDAARSSNRLLPANETSAGRPRVVTATFTVWQAPRRFARFWAATAD